MEIICVRGVQLFPIAGHPDASELAKYKQKCLGPFAKFLKVTIYFVMHVSLSVLTYVRLPVYPRGTTRLPPDRFS